MGCSCPGPPSDPLNDAGGAEALDEREVAWVRETWTAIQPHTAGGVYVNELGDDEGDDRVRLAYLGNYARLAKIKAQYDPGNLFHLNANIKPERTAAALP
jgi:FAD/FMN-containing dehydrogenase